MLRCCYKCPHAAPASMLDDRALTPPQSAAGAVWCVVQEDRFHLLQLFSVVEDSLCVLKEETRPLAFYPKDVFIVSAGIVADGPRHFFKREQVFIEG